MAGIVWWFGENSARIAAIDAEPISNIPQIKEEMREQYGRVIDELVVEVFVPVDREPVDGRSCTATGQANLDGKVFLEAVEALGTREGCGRRGPVGEGRHRLYGQGDNRSLRRDPEV